MRCERRVPGFVTAVLFILLICHPPGRAQHSVTPDDTTERARMLRQIDSLLERTYVLPEKAGEFATTFRAMWTAGTYDSVTNPNTFAEHVTADLRAITKDQHILFRVVEPSDIGEQAQGSLHHPVRYYRLRIRENTGFSRLEWLEGNVGYLDLRRFNAFSEAKAMAVAAMTFLSHANAIILDIRENGGGSGDYLSSFFLNHPTQLTGWYSREDGFLTEVWTLAEPGAERLTEAPLFVLTSGKTFSAAESFAYDMKIHNRATLVGEPTRGGAHSVDLFKIGTEFEIYIPTARAVDALTGDNWEGKGVTPDIAVPAAAAFDTALVLARQAGKAFGTRKEARLTAAVERMQDAMQSAENLYRRHQPESGKVFLDSVFSIGSRAGLITEFFVDVLAYNFTTQGDEEILYAILQKNIELFPRSATAYETLAYACFRNGETNRAIENYRRALDLDPGNRNAEAMIRRLQGM